MRNILGSVAASLAMLMCGNANAAGLIIETETFADKGGWVVDAQFMDVMDSPYLLAHGLGMPVADASTTVLLPESGRWHVFARTYNWTSPWHGAEDGAGAFRVAVDGVGLPAVLGTSGDRWQWQYAGAVNHNSGECRVSLTDLTGFDGRCDALFFTTDSLAVPLRTKAAVSHTACGYDIVVVGGGIAGMSAASAASRLGCRVALIQDRPVLGGNNSSEVRVHLGGALDVGPYPALGSLQKEFGPTREGNAQPAENYEDARKMEWMQAHELVDLYMNTHVDSVIIGDDNRIVAVIGRNTLDGSATRFEAPLFADCTGDGTVGVLAGARFMQGRENRAFFHESLAPENPDQMTMGASVQWRTRTCSDADSCRFPLFEYGLEFNDSTCRRTPAGEWTWETGMGRDMIYDFEHIRDYGLLVVYSNWSYLRNKLGMYPDRQLDWVAYVAGKRESRRLLGDMVLTQNDLLERKPYPDASFTTSWSIDLHFPDEDNSAAFPDEPFIASTKHTFIYPYPVPYRCLYSADVPNLFMAGRNISCTHVALGTVRVMRTTGMMGEVVGMAADICRRHGVSPRQVYESHLPELQQLMSRGVADPTLPNNQRYNEGTHLSD